jgi:hypothetical protein
MVILDVVMRLNGPIDPVGDSSIDTIRLVNLQSLCDLTGDLIDRIVNIAEATDGHLASVQAAKDVASAFLAEAVSSIASAETGGENQ